MTKEVTYYDIICDRCGKSLTNESETCYSDTESAEMVAKDSEWLTIEPLWTLLVAAKIVIVMCHSFCKLSGTCRRSNISHWSCRRHQNHRYLRTRISRTRHSRFPYPFLTSNSSLWFSATQHRMLYNASTNPFCWEGIITCFDREYPTDGALR